MCVSGDVEQVQLLAVRQQSDAHSQTFLPLSRSSALCGRLVVERLALLLPWTPGPVLLPAVVLALDTPLGPEARGGRSACVGAQALRSVSEAEALGRVSQVEGPDVEDVFEVGGVGGVCPQEGL